LNHDRAVVRSSKKLRKNFAAPCTWHRLPLLAALPAQVRMEWIAVRR